MPKVHRPLRRRSSARILGEAVAIRIESLETRTFLSASSIERVSLESAGAQADAHSSSSALSSDGRYVAFLSTADNLVAGDLPGHLSTFLRDRQTGVTTRVSRAPDGSQPNGSCFDPAISADGRYVVFSSNASNLVAGGTNGRSHVFVFDTQAQATTIVSASGSNEQGDFNSYSPSISGDGRFVTFLSDATNLVVGDTNNASDVFVYDRVLGVPTRVSVNNLGVEGNASSYNPVLSSDGRYVAFQSDATNLVAGDTNSAADIFVFDTQSAQVSRVSISSAGAQANGSSGKLAISSDGRYVAFESDASNLVAGDTNAKTDIFLRDRTAGTTQRVSVSSAGVQAGNDSSAPALSADGRYVAYVSNASNLIPGDTNLLADVFVYDRTLATTRRVSTGQNDSAANDASDLPAISGDGRFVSFFSNATILVPSDTNGVGDIFVKDLQASAKISLSGGAGNGTITAGAVATSTANGTDYGLVDINGETVTKTFTITNTGIETLRLTGSPIISFVGNQSDLTVSRQPGVSLLNPGESTTFDVTFNPSAVGTRLAVVTISTNDPLTPTFTFRAGGKGVDQSNLSRIVVIQDATTVTASFSYGTVDFDAAAPEVTFTILNTSLQTITLSAVALELNAGFVVSSAIPDPTVLPGNTTSFTLRMDTSTAGNTSARVRLVNSAFNVQNVTFNVTGHVNDAPPAVNPDPGPGTGGGGGGTGGTDPGTGGGTGGTDPGTGGGGGTGTFPDPTPGGGGDTDPVTAPPINASALAILQVDGQTVENGYSQVFAPVVQGQAQPSRQFTIRNDGLAVLHLGAPVLPAGFSLASAPAPVLQPGQSTSFVVALDTILPGSPGGPLTIPTDDPSATNILINLSGTVSTAPHVGLGVDSISFPKPLPATIVGGSKTKGQALVKLTNYSTEDLKGTYRVTLYASTGLVPNETGDVVLSTLTTKVKLKKAQSANVKAKLTFPVPAGTSDYKVFALITGAGVDPVYRLGKASSTTHIELPLARITSTTTPAPLAPWSLGKKANVTLMLTNNGNVKAAGTVDADVYLSTDGTISGAKAFKVQTLTKLKLSAMPGKAQKLALKLAVPNTLPGNFPAGNYTVVVVIRSGTPATPADISALTHVTAGTVTVS